MLKQTPADRVLFVRRLVPVALVYFVFAFWLLTNLHLTTPAYASAANTVNFQARLQSASGAIVPDGNYNVEFKLYSASSGGSALWTEDYLNSNSQGLQTINGYLTAPLGSITAFPSTIDWSQQLYLTMNIGGTGTSVGSSGSDPSDWDGEMNPRLALTATPYSFLAERATQADELATTSGSNTSILSIQGSSHGDQTFVLQDQGAAGTYDLLTASQADNSFIQLQSGTPAQQSGKLDISGEATFGSIATDSFDAASAAAINIGQTNAAAINLGDTTSNIATTINGTALVKPTSGHDSSTAFQVQDASGSTLLNVDTSSDTVNIGATGSTALSSTVNIGTSSSGSNAQTLNLGSGVGASTTAIQGGTGNLTLSTGDNSGATGSISILTGDSSTGTSGSITIDAGSNVPSGTQIEDKTFEDGTDDVGCWFVCNSAVQSTTEPHNGSNSLAATEAGTGEWGLIETYPGDATVTAGHTYAFSVWVRADTVSELITAGVTWPGSASGGVENFAFRVADSTSAWTELSGDLVAPAGATGVYFNIDASGTTGGPAVTYFDDMTVTDISTTTTPAINIGAANAEAITIGNDEQSAATTLQGGAGGVNIFAGTGANVNIGTSTNTAVTIGNTDSVLALTLQGSGITQTITGDSSNPSDIIATSTDSTAAFQVQDASGFKLLNVDTADDTISIGSAGNLTGTLQFANAGSSHLASIASGANAEDFTLTLPTDGATGSECLQSTSGSTSAATALQFGSCASGNFINAGTSAQSANFFVQAASSGTVAGTLQANASGSGDILDLLNGSNVTVEEFGSSGSVLFKPSTNSVTAFQIQPSGSTTSVLDADTTNGRIGVNTNAPGYALDVNGVINSNTSVDVNGVSVCTSSCIPSGGSGNYIQNSTSVQTSANFFIRSSSTSAPVGILQGANGQSADLLDLQTWNGTSSTTVDKFDSSGDLIVGANSTTAFQVQNGSVNLLTADVTHSVILIGSNSPTNSSNTTLLQLNSYDSFSDPASCSTTSNQGALYYSSDDTSGTNTIRGCINGSWQDILSAGYLGLELFGVVPDSPNAGAPGDLVGVSGNSNSPCKVYYSSSTAVAVAPCVAYSGGREVIVQSTTLSLSSIGASTYVNVCLTGTGNQPALVGTGSTTETSAGEPTWSATAPVLCLATVETTASAGTLGEIYDVRTFTDTTKEFSTTNTAVGLGWLMQGTSTLGTLQPTSSTNASGLRGVIVAYSGTPTSSAINMIIATAGPQWVKAISPSSDNNLVEGSATTGYTETESIGSTVNIDATLGMSNLSISTSCSNGTNCQFSQFLNPIDIR